MAKVLTAGTGFLPEAYMSEIEISVTGIDENSGDGAFQRLLKKFEEEHRVNVSVIFYNWATVWTEFMDISLHRRGPVISQTGNSWMSNLTARNCLRAFNDREMAILGGKQNFPPESWQSCLDFDNKNVFAIPWILDTYLVYYRRDLLAKAGIDEATAFSTPENFHSTLERLEQSGVTHPFSMPTNLSHSNILVVASWIWGQGGDFINSAGTRMLLSQPETRRGMKLFFDLFRFMPPEAKQLDDPVCWNLFLDGKIAVTTGSSERLFPLKRGELPEAFAKNIGTAVMPGVPLLGGSHLIIWNHIRYEQEHGAIELIKLLTSTDTGLMLFENIGLIPANLGALDHIAPNPMFAPAIQSVKKGRSISRLRMWGLIEERLVISMSQIWDELFSTPDPDVNQIVANHVDPIEARLNMILSQPRS